MGIQLLSMNHKVAPLFIRSSFAFTEQQQLQIMKNLRQDSKILETIILNTCNRMEIYVYAKEDKDCREVFKRMKQVVLEEAKMFQVENIGDYLLLYQGERAIHHLFQVTAGLDSMVIGEDQILGQVKHAHELARENQMCGTYLNTLFRYGITSAKKVKTDTELSKKSVSTASLSLKVAEKYLKTLKGKKILIIGATGKIGGIVFKNAQSYEGLEIFATVRTHSLVKEPTFKNEYQVIAYEDRYDFIDHMDVVISATASPHYTITKHHLEKVIKTHKNRVFIDLAVPMDIEYEIESMEGVKCFNMEDLKHLAKENNEKKMEEVKAADLILEDYETSFQKWLLFQQGLPDIQLMKEKIIDEIKEKGMDTALDHFFYGLREESDAEELRSFFSIIKKCTK